MAAPSAPGSAGSGPDDLGLRGAAIIVTGAGSGIGAATARRLGAAGASVVLVGRRAEALEAQAKLITEAGGEAHCVPADLAEPDSPQVVAAACRERYGRIDGLVNNAAVVRHRPIAEWTTDGFDEHFATNVRAPYFLIQAVLPDLLESPVKSVVNISSSSGALQLTGQSVYGTTKAALDYLTRTLAGELAPSGVRVNCIAPGPIDTPIHATWAARPGRGLPLAGRAGTAGPDRHGRRGRPLDRAAAEPVRLVPHRGGHPAGRRPGAAP